MIEVTIFLAVVAAAIVPVCWRAMTALKLQQKLLELQIAELEGPTVKEQIQEITGGKS